MKKHTLYIDNHLRARKWLAENPSSYEVYRDNITIHCKSAAHKKEMCETLVYRDGDLRDRRLPREEIKVYQVKHNDLYVFVLAFDTINPDEFYEHLYPRAKEVLRRDSAFQQFMEIEPDCGFDLKKAEVIEVSDEFKNTYMLSNDDEPEEVSITDYVKNQLNEVEQVFAGFIYQEV